MLGLDAPGALDRLHASDGWRPTVTIALGGNLLKMQMPPGVSQQVGGGKRGCITSYSRQSRRRLMEFFNSLDLEAVEQTPLFLTLTYPEVYPTNIQESKAHLFAFIKRIIRRYADAAVVWRLEWQDRGAPHYHLLVFNCPFIPHAEVAAWWYDTADTGDPRHLAAGTRIERIRSWNGVIFYASKYLGKLGTVPSGTAPGRLWGIVNRRCLPRRLLVRAVAWQEWYTMRRVLYRAADKQARATGRRARYVGLTIFTPATDAIRLFSSVCSTGLPPLIERR